MWRFAFGLLPFVVCTYMLGDAQTTSPAAAPATKATTKAPAKKNAPAPFKGPQVEQLPGFCDGSDKPQDPSKTCTANQQFFQARNAASMAVNLPKLPKYSSFGIRADGDSRLVVTCLDGKSCTKDQVKALETDISATARRYTTQLSAKTAEGRAQNIADKIKALHPDVVTTSIDSGQAIELASGADLTAEIDQLLTVSLTPVEVALPIFCVGDHLTGPAPHRMPQPPPDDRCGNQIRIQASNASQVQTDLAGDPQFTVTADSNSKVKVSVICKRACTQADLNRIEATIRQLAWPSPAYVQDVEVPAGTARTVAANIGNLNPMGITADAVGGDTVRLKSDAPVSGKDVDRIMEGFLFGLSAPPEFRMFYQAAGDVITGIAPPKSSTGSANSSDSSTSTNKSPTTNSSTTGDSTSSDSSQKNSTVVKFSSTTDTSSSVKNGGSQQGQTPTQNNGTPPPKAAPKPAPAKPANPTVTGDQAPAGPVTETKTDTTVTFTPPPPAPAAPKSPTPPPPVTGEMSVFKDNVVFMNPVDDGLTWQRIRLLTLLDLPRPEVLMNMWSFQASSSDGRETLKGAEKLRDLVTAYNNSLENSIQYGWAYLSREMKADPLNSTGMPWPEGSFGVGSADYLQATSLMPQFLPPQIIQPPRRFFDREFYNYVTQKFVYDRQRCTEPGCNAAGALLSDDMRTKWGFCPAGKYCLGFPQAFQPVRPNLTSILLGAIASEYPLKTILTTIGCMEGKYEVYGPECFPDRAAFRQEIQLSRTEMDKKKQNDPSWQAEDKCRQTEQADESVRQEIHEYEQEYLQLNQELQDQNRSSQQHCQECVTRITDRQKAILKAIDTDKGKLPCPGCKAACRDSLSEAGSQERKQADDYYQKDIERARLCIKKQRLELIREKHLKDQLSCELLDTIAREAQDRCGVPQTFPLSCFTIQAAQSFSSPADVSTFTLEQLNALAEERLADIPIPEGALPGSPFSTTRIGLLRAAIADFLFNYKMSQEFPKEFVPYDLQHSAQELNAELNPLVIAFNQDVAAFSRNLQNRMEVGTSRKDFVSDGIITVRGIGGDQSAVDTLTQNFFDATQPVSLSDLAAALTGQGGSSNQSGGSAGGSASPLLTGGAVTSATLIPALAALVPKPTEAQIGKQLCLTVTPTTLPGASSAELQLTLKAGEDADPTLYQSGKNVGLDNVSRVALHKVTTRVRVESVKMFEVSSFSALLQRPRSKLPLLPPFVQLPGIGSLMSLPLPGAKEYHRSSAIVSAVIVPTAADLAYGIDFSHDRLITRREDRETFEHDYQMKLMLSLSEVPRAPIRAFHKAMVSCFATNGLLPFPGGGQFDPSPTERTCGKLTFASVPPER